LAIILRKSLPKSQKFVLASAKFSLKCAKICFFIKLDSTITFRFLEKEFFKTISSSILQFLSAMDKQPWTVMTGQLA
jgi:hypothetical protein